jgi:hypothetical protein
MYPKIATGTFQFSLVGDLLESFGYKANYNRQKRTKHRTRGYSPYYQSLERNFRNFKKTYPLFCERLKAELVGDHNREEECLPISDLDRALRPNGFDWARYLGCRQPSPR